jgi:hypothetical protein
MKDLREIQTESMPGAKLDPKLRAALEYLGDRLTTHAASRFKPLARPLLDEWLATRRSRPRGSMTLALGAYRSWASSSSEWS